MQSFYDIVINMGLAERLKAMIDDVERSIVAYPDGPDQRYLARLENQLERLRHPDLRLLVALSTQMCVDHPDRAGDVAARLGELLPAHPYLTGRGTRLRALGGADRPRLRREKGLPGAVARQ